MAQRVITKLADSTSGTATQLTVALPATAIGPATGTATSGVSLAGLDGIIVISFTSAAVALTQGVTIAGQDAGSSLTMAPLVAFNAPTAGTTPVVYFYGVNISPTGTGIAASSYFACSGYMMDKLQIQATPGAASTVRLVVYGVRSLP